MAQRRMMSLKVCDTDAFLDMPQGSQNLYFHLILRADDDGFVSNPKKIMKMVSSAEDDIKILNAKKFVIPFESGVVVISHWRVHNLIRSDRYEETQYLDEKKALQIENGVYSKEENVIPNGNQMAPQVRLGEVRVGKDREEEKSPDKPELHLSYLKEIPKDDVKEFVQTYKVTEYQLIGKANDLFDWCESNGKRKKNYKAFLRVAVKKDFGIWTPEERIQQERIDRTKALGSRSSVFAKELSGKMKM